MVAFPCVTQHIQSKPQSVFRRSTSPCEMVQRGWCPHRCNRNMYFWILDWRDMYVIPAEPQFIFLGALIVSEYLKQDVCPLVTGCRCTMKASTAASLPNPVRNKKKWHTYSTISCYFSYYASCLISEMLLVEFKFCCTFGIVLVTKFA
jgi:hypothetical protein